ncbi:MAG: ATP-binding protein [Bacillota bacterium]
MSRPSDSPDAWDVMREKVLGLGERSVRKSHYPQLQQRLAELERFRALLDSSSDMILLVHLPSGAIADASHSACQSLGYSCEQLRSRSIPELVDPAASAWATAMLAGTTSAEVGQQPIDTFLRRSDGQSLSVEVTCSSRQFADARYAIVVARDNTERKRAEAAMARAKEAADAANQAKDRFLASLSHELRTPLTPVLAIVSSLVEDPSISARLREDLATIRRNIELESRLIDDLLDLTRINRGKLELRYERVDVHAILRHAIRICCDPQITGKRLHVQMNLEAAQHYLRGDGSRLEQIFWNLLNNAVKFTPEGGAITVRSCNPEEGGIVVEITDTGIGIEPEAFPKLFDAFAQGGRSIMRQFGGLGLGLAISKALAELHDGRIAAESPGCNRGATFRVTLPIATIAEIEPKIMRPAAVEAERGELPGAVPSGAKVSPRNRSVRILLVEDHPDTAKTLSRLLQADGHEVTVASNIASALSLADSSQGRFELVVSDLGLPDGSGHDLMRTLNHRYGLSGVAISGFGTEADIRKSLNAGFAEHLTKPVNLAHLESAIHRVAAMYCSETRG